MRSRSLRPQLNQIRAWVRQGRTDAWIAHQLEVTVQQIQAFKREQQLEPGEDTEGAAAADYDDEIDLRAEDDALIAAELDAAAAETSEDEEDEDEDAEKPARRRRQRRRQLTRALTVGNPAAQRVVAGLAGIESERAAGDRSQIPRRRRRRRHPGGDVKAPVGALFDV